MQFGVTDHIDARGVPPAELLEQRLRLVELYERLGFDRYMLTEHHGTPLNLVPSPHLFLAAASQRTSRIHLGTLVTLLPLYNPVRLIEEVGVLDLLTRGRLELGVGRGVSPPEIATYGIDPEQTRAMFDEAFEILIKGLTSDELSHEGHFYTIRDALMVVPTIQKPRPALWYGVGSVEKAEWAARRRVNMMSLLPPEMVRPFTDRFLEVWEETGRPAAERPLRGVNRNLVIAEDGDEARRIAEEAYAPFRRSLMFLWERSGVPAPPVFPPTFAEWQAQGGAFAGTPEEARQYVADQVQVAGLDTMSFHLAFGTIAYEHVCRTAELFTAEVMPAFAEVRARGVSIVAAVEAYRDIAYASTAERELTLDLYLPEDRREPCPIVLYLHGGAFMVGAKEDHAEPRLAPVARGGIGVASASYRFSDMAHYPAQLHDVKAAVRWLRAHASEYGYRADRLGAWGASAGGYLALMLGLTGGSHEHEGTLGEHLDQSSAVNATCAWFASVDLLHPVAPPPDRPLPPILTGPWPPVGPSPAARLLGLGDVADDPDSAAAASPINHVAGSRGAFLLMHGDADAMVAEDESRRLHEALVAGGANSTLLLLAGANHEDPLFHSPAALGAVAGFFAAAL